MALLRPMAAEGLQRRWRWAGAGLALAGLLLAGASIGRAQGAAGVEEYRIKAVFVLNFVHFVQWPPRAEPASAAPLVIGVLGSDPEAPYLEEAVRGESFGTHPLVVQRYRRIEDVDGCQILFIGRSEAGDLRRVLAGLKDRSILTVGDDDRFSERGGMIALVTANKKIRLKINVGAAQAADLRIDARLLRPAQIVSTEAG